MTQSAAGDQNRGLPALPSHWRWASPPEFSAAVDNALTIGPFGSSLKVSDYTDSGVPLVFVRNIRSHSFRGQRQPHISESKAASLRAHVVRSGDVLITKMGDPPGDAAVYPENMPAAVITADCIKWTLHPLIADPRFVMYATAWDGVKRQILAATRGVAQKKVSLERFRAVQYPLPPLPEQKAIVSEIEKHFTRLDVAVASLKHAQAKLKAYRAAVLKAAVEGRFVATEAALASAERRSAETGEDFVATVAARLSARSRIAPLDTSALPPTPDGWTWVPLPALGEVSRGKSRHRPRDDVKLYGGPYPFIQTADVKHSGGFIRRHSQTYSEQGLRQSRLWPAGTLCITIAANIAETGILTYEACFPDSVVGFLHPGESITVRFLDIFFRTVRGRLARFAPATAQKNINLDTLVSLAVPVPPLAEQRRIVEAVERNLSVIDRVEAQVEFQQARASSLRKCILREAFAGTLLCSSDVARVGA